jgi:acyl carrier protein
MGRDSLARLVGRAGGGRPLCADEDDARLREVEPTLRRIIGESLGVKPERLEAHAALVADLGIDPLDVLDVMTRVESVVGIAFPEGEIDALRTFEDLVIVTRALLSVRLGRAVPPPAATCDRGRVRRSKRPLTPTTARRSPTTSPVARHRRARDRVPGAPAGRSTLDAALLASFGGRRTTVRRALPPRAGSAAAADPRGPNAGHELGGAPRRAPAVDLLERSTSRRTGAYTPEIQAARAQTNRRIAGSGDRTYAPARLPPAHG